MKVCLACQDPILQETPAQAPDNAWRCPSCGFSPEAHTDGMLCFSPELARECSGFESDLFPRLAALEAKHFWYRARNWLIIWAFKRFFPEAQHFFEIGCGTGFVISGLQQALPQIDYAGSEAFPEGLAFAAQRLKNASLWQMDARKLPFVEEFDVIGAFDVIEHIQEDEQVLTQMAKATKPGGGILITVPQHQFLWSQSDVRAHHVRRYESADLIQKIDRAGFKVVFASSFVSLLLPGMWLSRKLEKDTDKVIDESYEFNIHPVLNSVFEAVMRMEIALIQWGVRFPMGGSLLVVARKVKPGHTGYMQP